MARTPRGVQAHARHKKILNLAKGYRGASSRSFRNAKQAVIKASQYAYRDRRNKRRTLRALWIMRINAAARLYDTCYSKVINGLNKANVVVNRKILSELACIDNGRSTIFADIIKQSKKST